MRIKERLLTFKDVDIWSLVLFTLYKIKDLPEYSSISELAYILDKDNMLKLCEYFGGLTIKIPTIDELEEIVYALVLYQYVNIDGMEYDEAVKLLGEKSSNLRNIKSGYLKVCDVLNNYEFSKRE
jgi:hypothetical protein